MDAMMLNFLENGKFLAGINTVKKTLITLIVLQKYFPREYTSEFLIK